MSNTDFLLAIEDLTVSFDGFKAIDSLNLYLERGELRVVIGPNGAGKTTLLDLICGKTRETRAASSSATRKSRSSRNSAACVKGSAASSRRRRFTKT